jgi:hypothetical protein
MSNRSKKIIATGLFGLTLFAGGCAARTGPIRGEANVEGDSTSASGRSQVNKDTQAEGQKKSSGAVSGSATGSGSVRSGGDS